MPNIFILYGNDEFAITRRLKDFESDFTDPTTAGMNTAHLNHPISIWQGLYWSVKNNVLRLNSTLNPILWKDWKVGNGE